MYSEYRVYSDGRTNAHLIGMMHIGGANFYDITFGDLIASDDGLYLLEGITDKNRLLKDKKAAYENMKVEGWAKRIGSLTSSFGEH